VNKIGLVGRYFMILLAGVVLTALASAGLEVVAHQIPELRRSPTVWGTYGDWASALVPTFAVLLTAELWRRDHIRSDERLERSKVSGLRLDRRDGGLTWLVNASRSTLTVVATSCSIQIEHVGATLEPNNEVPIGENTNYVSVLVMESSGIQWSVDRDGLHGPRVKNTRDSALD
jgi:hypothetical protein